MVKSLELSSISLSQIHINVSHFREIRQSIKYYWTLLLSYRLLRFTQITIDWRTVFGE